MLWLCLLGIAIALIAYRRLLCANEEVHAIALQVASLLSALWGLVIAPPAVQLGVGVVGLGLLRLYPLR